MSEMDQHTISGGSMSATVASAGAELCSLRDGLAREYIWQAGLEWPRHAPVLFPIVGRLRDDRLSVTGQSYRMTQHGFARDRTFLWVERTAASCRLMLADDEATRAHYPFAFHLEIAYALDERGLSVRYTVINKGGVVLPASLGAHPAFQWPLPASSAAKMEHFLTFEADETEPVYGVSGGLLKGAPEPTPIQNRLLPLNDRLFANDALILLSPASRWVRFHASDGPAIVIGWDGFEQLGIWSKPSGAGFLCIEPWRGYASPASFDGEFQDKPGLMLIEPGGRRDLSWRVDILEGGK